MAIQRAKYTAAEVRAKIEALFDRPLLADAKVSGGQIEHFRAGWAKDVMTDTKVHFFRRHGFDKAKALCGFVGDVRWLFDPGNLDKCYYCRRRLGLVRSY